VTLVARIVLASGHHEQDRDERLDHTV
jgi:hypothetical protein